MPFTKADLIDKVHASNPMLTKAKTREAIETILHTIKSSLASNEDVLVSGFGKFCVQEKRKRKGRNPATGETLMLKSRRVVTFKCSGKLRKRINKDVEILRR